MFKNHGPGLAPLVRVLALASAAFGLLRFIFDCISTQKNPFECTLRRRGWVGHPIVSISCQYWNIVPRKIDVMCFDLAWVGCVLFRVHLDCNSNFDAKNRIQKPKKYDHPIVSPELSSNERASRRCAVTTYCHRRDGS